MQLNSKSKEHKFQKCSICHLNPEADFFRDGFKYLIYAKYFDLSQFPSTGKKVPHNQIQTRSDTLNFKDIPQF